MCRACEEAELELVLSEAEELVILAEIEDRSAPTYASRPLSEPERRSEVRFRDLEDLHNETEEASTGILADLEEVVQGAVLGALYAGATEIDPDDLARGLAALNVTQPRAVQEAVADAAVRLQDTLSTAYSRSSSIALDEGRRQGSKLAEQGKPRAVSNEVFAGAAAAAALYPWARITGKIQRDTLTPARMASGPIARAELLQEIDAIPLDGAVDVARQAANQAIGRGRFDTAVTLAPSEIWASELLDSATCSECRKIDGREYSTLEDAREDYPVGGYYRCKGEARCRGTLVIVYDPNAEDTPPDPPNLVPPPAPRPAPVAPAPRTPRAPRKPRVPKPAPAPVEVPVVVPDGPPVPKLPRRTKNKAQRFTDLRQLPRKSPETADLKPIDDALVVNPEHDKTYKTKIYNSNCTSVVAAYELRRRGFDVTAAPVPNGKGRYTSEYLRWWQNEDGTPAQATYHNGKEGALAYLATLPAGARATIAVHWKGGGGHIYNYDSTGDPPFLEGQIGKPDATGHLDRIDERARVEIIRVDNLVPTPAILDAVEYRSPEYLVDKGNKEVLEEQKRRSVGRLIGYDADGKPQVEIPRYKAVGRKYELLDARERSILREEVRQWIAAREDYRTGRSTIFPNRPLWIG